ncbi:hypothetical protein FHU39_004492 [Flexivirga oryzae]|uniref:Uncharacterized protein n=1 Tax=Flexivirga oryzae TaxID=1794944 RepID=A0A839N9L7_9MICO|nr:hypothetical protein [Flexivirga oryzae]
MLDLPWWNDFQTFELLGGVSAVMGFDDADDDIGAALLPAMSFLEHLHGLAHTG